MSWEELVEIVSEGKAERRDANSRKPVACPNCGEPLKDGPRGGVLFCPGGDYEWPRDGVRSGVDHTW